VDYFDPWYLLVAGVFGAIGMGVFMYGKREADFLWLFDGIALCAASYFITSPPLLTAVSVGLIALLFHERILLWFSGDVKPRKDIESI